MSRTAIVFVTLAAFALGFAAGGLGGRAYERAMFFRGPGPGHPPPIEDVLKERMFRELDLDEVQRKSVGAILERTHRDVGRIMGTIRPEIDARLDRTGEAIRPLLRPEQVRRFDEMEAERRARMDRMDRGE